MTAPHIAYAQSGGVTAVINATAGAVIRAAQKHPQTGRVYAAKNGILGILHEQLYQTWREDAADIALLRHTPGGAFGSCRVKLPTPADDLTPYRRMQQVFQAHDIGALLYNGGNDSADTSLKISSAMQTLGHPFTCIGIPKTIDNDLPATDCCPGFGSAAKYVAVSVAETTLDLASMSRTSTKVFILEVMGRHAGWIAAAAGLAGKADGPHLILFPEIPFHPSTFVAALKKRVAAHGYAVVVVSEGIRDEKGEFLSGASGPADGFSHRQLGGVAPAIAALVTRDTSLKCHWAVADYMQRAAAHIASATDIAHAEAVGGAAVDLAAQGADGIMPIIRRLSESPYRWQIATAPLTDIANRERKLPASFITGDNYFITQECRRYLQPLIEGENFPPYARGLPRAATLKNILADQRLPPYSGA